jgi:hypothetical protein
MNHQKLLVLIIAFVGIPLLTTCSNEPKTPPHLAKKLALLVGINTYHPDAKISPLAGCINDIEDMRSMLKGKFDFDDNDILVLKNEQATHEGIIKAFRDHLIGDAEKDAIAVFHFSGHGSQMWDTSGDEIDSLDETIVPYDSRQGNVYDITDDDINQLLQELSAKTKNITVVFDACHSGTATRATGRIREIPMDPRVSYAPPSGRAKSRGGIEGKADLRRDDIPYTLVAGCLSKQSSYEYSDGGKEHGALSFFLTKALLDVQAKKRAVTWRDIFSNVKGEVMAACPGQTPQLEGTMLDNYVFSDSSSLSQPFVEVNPKQGKLVTFDAGEVQGVTKGSVFDVYAPGKKKFDPPEQPLAKVKVTGVDVFSAEGEIVSGKTIPQHSRAVEKEHNYADKKLVVCFSGLARSTTLKQLRESLKPYKNIDAKTDPWGYHVLVRDTLGTIVTEGPDTVEISPRVSTGTPDATETVVKQLNHWARWYNLLSVSKPTAQMANFTINVLEGDKSRDPFAGIDTADAVIHEGDRYECKIENVAERDLYLSILDLSTDGSVSVLYPFPDGAAELLKHGATVVRRFRATIPKDRSQVTDVIRVYLTSSPIDLHPVTMDAVRDGLRPGGTKGPSNPLAQLLEQAAYGGSRGAAQDGIPLDNWATADRVFKIKKAGQ